MQLIPPLFGALREYRLQYLLHGRTMRPAGYMDTLQAGVDEVFAEFNADLMAVRSTFH
jgi:hypothetical protein